jgi:hypothetical protein
MFVMVFLFLLRNELPILETVGNYASLIILILGVIILLSWWRYRMQKSLNREIALIYSFWMIMLIWFMIVPIIFPMTNAGLQPFYEGMYHDYRYLLFATLPFVFITNAAKTYYDKVFRNVGYFALIFGCVGVIIADKSFASVSSRGDVWSLSYYFWWVVIMVFPYLFLKYYFNRNLKIGLYLIILHFILSLLFLKRAGFVDALLLILLAILFSKNLRKASSTIVIISLFVLFSLLFFSDYLDLVLNRFLDTGENIEEWDRITEVDNYFAEATQLQQVTGFGANNYLNMSFIGIEDKAVNSLHIGAYNILYKGGFLYATFILFLIIKIISLYKYINYNVEIKIGFILGIVFVTSFTYQQGWSYVPTIFFTLLPIYRAIYLKDKLKSQQRKIN